MSQIPPVEYTSDAQVDDVLDRELRRLLSTCYTAADVSAAFRERRYLRDCPQHRWFIWGQQGELASHVAVHERTSHAQQRQFKTAGIGSVCVAPAYRRRGFVRIMLAAVHEWLIAWQFAFAILFGNPSVYRSSGYVQVENILRDAKTDTGEECRKPVPGMIRELSETSWPSGEVYLPRPSF